MLSVGALLYLALKIVVGLPFALAFALLSAVAETVPYVGALASGVPPVAFALTISPGTAWRCSPSTSRSIRSRPT